MYAMGKLLCNRTTKVQATAIRLLYTYVTYAELSPAVVVVV
jgi:hypothetical protein